MVTNLRFLSWFVHINNLLQLGRLKGKGSLGMVLFHIIPSLAETISKRGPCSRDASKECCPRKESERYSSFKGYQGSRWGFLLQSYMQGAHGFCLKPSFVTLLMCFVFVLILIQSAELFDQILKSYSKVVSHFLLLSISFL